MLALIDVPTYCPLLLEVRAKSLTLGQTPITVNGLWQRQFPESFTANGHSSAKMHINAPNAAVTLSLMQQKNAF
jgi:hypothetical protein